MSFVARSIAAKVAVAFSFVILTLVVIYIVMAQRLDTISHAMDNVTEISNNTISIIRINKDIIEMQRDVSVFSLSGSDAVFDKIEENYADIKIRLDLLSSFETSVEERQYIHGLTTLVAELGDNLSGLSSLYRSRNLLIDNVLEDIYQSAIGELAALETQADSVENKLIAAEMTNYWHALHRNAWLFLSKKDYSKRQEVNALLQTISATDLNGDEALSNRMNALVRDYQTSFFKSIQVNRNYFNLVNVVMAGNAIEFGTLANQLREHSLARLQDIKRLGQDQISTTVTILNSLGIAIIVYLIFLAFFFHVYVTKAITRLTLSFSRFLNGDLSAPINHTHRKDEIGVLAQAASRFRDMSKDLEREKRAAEHSAKVKSEFLANMSHEIRTPMNGILGMATQLSDTPLTKPQTEMLDIIVSSGESLLVIINDILDLSKIEADKIELEQRPIALRALLKDLTLLFNGQATAKGIQLRSEVLPVDQPLVFLGDETRLKQVLMNLLGNAIKFTDQGEVVLTATIQQDAQGSVTLLLSVTDTGIGIESDNIEKLFDAFSQADTSITRKFGGTGLGLTITHKLLQLMDSKLNVESETGKGSRFFFEIEAQKGAVEPDTPRMANMDTSEDLDLSSLNVLVAEDNKTNQLVMKGFLAKLSIDNVMLAEDGERAVELCRDHAFDLIFMDMQMPVKDGLQATLDIKAMHQYQPVPIIALTANVLEDDKNRCLAVGMCDFVSKPISLEALDNTIKKWSTKESL